LNLTRLEQWAIVAAGLAALVAVYYAWKDHHAGACSCSSASAVVSHPSDLYL